MTQGTPWRRWLRIGFLVLAFALLVAALVSRWDEVAEAMTALDIGWVVLALAVSLLGLGASMMSWRALLSGLHATLPVRACARIYFLGQIGKYIPGSLWPVLAQAELGRDHGVPRARSGVVAMLSVLVSLVTGVAVAAAGLALSSPEALAAYGWTLLVIPLGAVALWPPVLTREVALALRLARRPGQAQDIGAGAVIRSVLWAVAMWVLFGVHAWALVVGLGASGPRLGLLATGAYALAWTVGFLVIILPAGAGAREAALVLALSGVLTEGQALVVAVISRAVMIAADAMAAGGAAMAMRGRRAVAAHGGTAEVAGDTLDPDGVVDPTHAGDPRRLDDPDGPDGAAGDGPTGVTGPGTAPG